MKYQFLFPGKNKKNISKCSLLKSLPRMVSVKLTHIYLCINAFKLPWPCNIIQELSVIISVVVRAISLCMVTWG